MATPNSVLAKAHNQMSFEEGIADEALEPGQGCVLYEDANGEKRVRTANANEKTTRIVRERRNPPVGMGLDGDSPLAQGYDIGENVETISLDDNDQARCRVTYEVTDTTTGATAPVEDAPLNWGADGNLTTGGTEPVAYGRVDISSEFANFDMVIAEFY